MCHLSKETWTRVFNLGLAVKREMATSPAIRSVQIDQPASSLSINGDICDNACRECASQP